MNSPTLLGKKKGKIDKFFVRVSHPLKKHLSLQPFKNGSLLSFHPFFWSPQDGKDGWFRLEYMHAWIQPIWKFPFATLLFCLRFEEGGTLCLQPFYTHIRDWNLNLGGADTQLEMQWLVKGTFLFISKRSGGRNFKDVSGQLHYHIQTMCVDWWF